MPTIKIYQYEISPYADKVRRALHLKGAEYEVVEVLASQAGKWKSVSPTGKFPALGWDDEIIVDSTDIIQFLEQKLPEPRLIPTEAKAKAMAHILEDWADESLYYYDVAIRAKPNNVGVLVDDIIRHEKGLAKTLIKRVVPAAARKMAHGQGLGRKDTAILRRDINTHFESLNTLLADSAWLAGDHLSVADIAVASMLHVLIRAEEPAEDLPKHAVLHAWKQRVDERTLPT